MKIRHIAIIALAVMAASCQEEYGPQDWSERNESNMSFKLNVRQSDGSNLTWPQASQVGVFCEQSGAVNTAVEISVSSTGTEEGTFFSEIGWSEGVHKIICYYPYDKECESTILTGTLPKTLLVNGESATGLSGYNLYVKTVETEPLAGGEFIQGELNPIFSTGKMKISTTKYGEYALDRVEIKAPAGKVLYGDYSFDTASGELKFTGNTGNELAINVADVKLGGTKEIFFLKSGENEFQENCDVKLYISKGEENIVLEGKGKIGEEAPLQVDGWEAEMASDDTFDLSNPTGDKRETANCYIVGKAGETYKFPATIMGNGQVTPAETGYGITNAPGITPTKFMPSSAKVLWQTEKNLLTNIKFKNGYIYFTVNGELGGKLMEGNAVIAAYSEPDGGGYILWSWHIWVTAADLEAKLQTWKVHDTYASCDRYQSPQLMDRNLGALSDRGWDANQNNLDNGLNYQWGRKDPFISLDDSKWGSTTIRKTYDADNNEIFNFEKAGEDPKEAKWTYLDKKPLTMETIGRYPMAFYWSGSTGHDQSWIDEPRLDLWGCPNYPDDSNEIGQKTIFDPCPPGYRVMNAYAMSGLMASPVGGNLNKADGEPNIPNALSFSADKAALQVKYDGNNISYIPLSGIVFFEKVNFPVTRTGSYGYLWTSKASASTGLKAYRLHIDVNHCYIGGGKGNGYISYGHNVRCEKIK